MSTRPTLWGEKIVSVISIPPAQMGTDAGCEEIAEKDLHMAALKQPAG
jgi:hypothetical protein